jgi:hypothetical protein
MSPLVRAKRILNPMERFKADFKNNLPSYVSVIPADDRRNMVGIYENTEASVAECVVITVSGLLIEKGGVWERHAFSEVKAAHAPPKEQGNEESLGVTIEKTDSTSIFIPIRGRQGRFQDAFEFTRFLIRVSDDAKMSG